MATTSYNSLRYGDINLTTTGKVLQVVTATKTDSFSSTSSSYTDLTGITANITPASTSNKVMIYAIITLQNNDDVNHAYALLKRGTDTLIIADTASNRTSASMVISGTQTLEHPPRGFTFLDSPSSTSELTYKIQVKGSNTNGIYCNRSAGDNDAAANDGRSVSTFTLMEIEG